MLWKLIIIEEDKFIHEFIKSALLDLHFTTGCDMVHENCWFFFIIICLKYNHSRVISSSSQCSLVIAICCQATNKYHFPHSLFSTEVSSFTAWCKCQLLKIRLTHRNYLWRKLKKKIIIFCPWTSGFSFFTFILAFNWHFGLASS